MNAFTIRDLENLSGIKAHTIRIWEQRYSFLKPQRTDTNIRYYSNDELKTILNIALLNKYGYKISHIDKMSEGEMRSKILALTQADAQQERIVNELIQFMVDLDLENFEQVINSHIHTRGVEKTITGIIFPFLERIGILWLTNHINPAQEHLVSNLIRQKIIAGIENASSGHLHVNKTAMLFLPEGEHHEMALLFINYLLRSRGLKVLYLGSNVPLHDVAYVNDLKKPDFIYTHITSIPNNFSFEKFLNKLSSKVNNTTVIISGQAVQGYKRDVPVNIYLKKSLSEMIEYVSTIH